MQMEIAVSASMLELTEPQNASKAAVNQLKDGKASQVLIIFY